MPHLMGTNLLKNRDLKGNKDVSVIKKRWLDEKGFRVFLKQARLKCGCCSRRSWSREMPQRVLSDVNQEAPWGWGESEPGPRPRQLSAATSASSPVSLTPSHISLHLLQCASASLHPSASSRGSLHIRGIRQYELWLPVSLRLACSYSSGMKCLRSNDSKSCPSALKKRWSPEDVQ